MEQLTITCTDITDVRARFHRIQTKALLLARSPRQKQMVLGRAPTIFSIGLSEFTHSEASESRLQNFEHRLEQIESKLDRLLEMQHESRNSPPNWFAQSSEQLLREIGSVGDEIKDLASCRAGWRSRPSHHRPTLQPSRGPAPPGIITARCRNNPPRPAWSRCLGSGHRAC